MGDMRIKMKNRDYKYKRKDKDWGQANLKPSESPNGVGRERDQLPQQSRKMLLMIDGIDRGGKK